MPRGESTTALAPCAQFPARQNRSGSSTGSPPPTSTRISPSRPLLGRVCGVSSIALSPIRPSRATPMAVPTRNSDNCPTACGRPRSGSRPRRPHGRCSATHSSSTMRRPESGRSASSERRSPTGNWRVISRLSKGLSSRGSKAARVPRTQPTIERISDERRFELLVQAITDYAIYMLDPKGYIVSWNVGAERIKGYRSDEIIGRHFSLFFTDEDRAAEKPAFALATALRTGRFEDESWRVRKDGSRFWAVAVLEALRDPSGQLIGFAKITRDITERRAAQQALRESERRFRLLVDSVVDYAMYMLDLEGRVTNWNIGAQRIKGYSADEIIGEHFSKFYTEEDRAAGLPMRALGAAAKDGKFQAEGWRVRK